MRGGFFVLSENVGWTVSGNPIVIGVFRTVTLAEFPAYLPPLCVAIEVESDPTASGAEMCLLRLIDEDGATVFEHPLQFEFRARPNMGPNYSYFAGPLPEPVQVRGPGRYRFDLLWRDTTVSQAVLEIERVSL